MIRASTALCAALAAACGSTLGHPPFSEPDLDASSSEDAGDPPPASDDSTNPTGDAAIMAPCDGDWLVPDSTGFIAADTNASKITGRWYLHRDCDDYAGLEAGTPIPGTDCSQVFSPMPGSPFAPAPGTAHMCTSGQTIHVMSDSDWPTEWGAYVALDLNSPLGTPGDFNAAAAGLSGFCFYVSGSIVPVFRIRLPTDQGIVGGDWYQVTLQHEGWHRVLFEDLGQVTPSATPFDPTKLVSIEIEVPASRGDPIAWDFCIEALVGLR